jgi:hypothetical protein
VRVCRGGAVGGARKSGRGRSGDDATEFGAGGGCAGEVGRCGDAMEDLLEELVEEGSGVARILTQGMPYSFSHIQYPLTNR